MLEHVSPSLPSAYRKRCCCSVLSRDADSLSAGARKALEAASQGIAALELIPEPWQGRLTHLVCAPHLIVETLVMAQELSAAQAVLSHLPGLSNDDVVLLYAR